MTHPILGSADPGPEIYQRVGQVAAEFAWIEKLLAEMLAYFCKADPGAMYVITQSVSAATMTDWLRTLTQIQIHHPTTAKVIGDLLTEVDEIRAERNTIVHGTWIAGEDATQGIVQTFRWDRAEVVKTEVWSTADLDAVISHLSTIQLMLANLGIKFGFLASK